MRQVVSLTADDVKAVANWPLVIEAIRAGHERPKADIGDTFVHARNNTMLVRSAYIDGLAAGVKAATVVPDNPNRTPPLPSIHAQIMLFDPDSGELAALVDGTEVTAWKTAGDSALGSALLSREDSKVLLMVGAGSMAEPLIRAHICSRPGLETVIIFNRTQARAEAVAANLADLKQTVRVVTDLDAAIPEADIICCATMTNDPVLKGALVATGTHVDLVGAYKADMREADDDLHTCADWFVDSFDTTLDHIGEFTIPIAAGLIGRNAAKGDLHALVDGSSGRNSAEQITVFKNGGGAHLDIMVSAALVAAHQAEAD
ncbi:MAG: ornithine cyclodeaminase [Rhizobiaceae bacterium]|nr:Gfo/Idh/MocA family oxidoreductase [Hyphomicrobiales bacterium]NRB31083.1 ornithine cyclodeaminase [Rhizobiaceae bacterium]